MTTGEETVDAIQQALAAEHAAVYGYGIIGAHLSGKERQQARDAYNAHRRARDQLRSMVRASGATPTPAAPDYSLQHSATDPSSAVRLATRVEESVAAAYVEVVATSGDGEESGPERHAARRRYAAKRVRDCALRSARWRGSSVPFPGLPDAGRRGSG